MIILIIRPFDYLTFNFNSGYVIYKSVNIYYILSILYIDIYIHTHTHFL